MGLTSNRRGQEEIIIAIVVAAIIIGGLYLSSQKDDSPELNLTLPDDTEPTPQNITEPVENDTEQDLPEEDESEDNQTEENTTEPAPECDYECCSDDDCGGIEVCCDNSCEECCSDSDCIRGMACRDNICVEDTEPEQGPSLGSFDSLVFDSGICTENGKPIIRLYSTSGCGHCSWVKPAFNDVVDDYSNRIVAHNWVLDKEDDALTPQDEDGIPPREYDIYDTFNPANTVPTFVFGCKYYRVGTAYEREDNLAAERSEFRNVIDALLGEV
jgi:thiol-disulfide isomerase/thioredoxin